MNARRRVMRRPELQIMRPLGNPGRVLEYATKRFHKPPLRHRRWAFGHRGRMMGGPMVGDLRPCREPDALVARHVVKRAFQRSGPAWSSDQTAVKADGQHLGRARLPFGVERIETVLQIGVELVARVEPLRRGEAHVVGIERVRHDQLIPPPEPHPIRQIIGIAVGNIRKTALFGGQPNRVHRTAAGVPAARTLAHDLAVKPDRFDHMRAFIRLRKILVFNPFEPVRRDLPACRLHRGNLFRRPRQGGRDAVYRDRQILQQPVETPEPCARAVFVDRLHVPMPLAFPGRRPHDFGQERLRGRVAVKYVVLAALLVVQHDLNRDFRSARPLRIRRRRAIAGHVAWISCHVARSFRGLTPVINRAARQGNYSGRHENG